MTTETVSVLYSIVDDASGSSTPEYAAGNGTGNGSGNPYSFDYSNPTSVVTLTTPDGAQVEAPVYVSKSSRANTVPGCVDGTYINESFIATPVSATDGAVPQLAGPDYPPHQVFSMDFESYLYQQDVSVPQPASTFSRLTHALFDSSSPAVQQTDYAVEDSVDGVPAPDLATRYAINSNPSRFDRAVAGLANLPSVQSLGERIAYAFENSGAGGAGNPEAHLLADAVRGAIGSGMVALALGPEIPVLGAVAVGAVGATLMVGAVADAIDKTTGTTDVVGYLHGHSKGPFDRIFAALERSASP